MRERVYVRRAGGRGGQEGNMNTADLNVRKLDVQISPPQAEQPYQGGGRVLVLINDALQDAGLEALQAM